MERSLGTLLVLLSVFGASRAVYSSVCTQSESIYDDGYSFPLLDGSGDIKMGDYKGKVVMLMNTATYWGLNRFNNLNMNALIQEVNSTNFVVLGFPCNQFGLQEPAQNAELMNGYKYVRPGDNFVPLFPLTEKTSVNGDDSHKMFDVVRSQCPGTTSLIGVTSGMYWSPVTKNDITWNYEKFLIDPQGMPYKRYHPSFNPMNTYDDIQELFKQIPGRQMQKSKELNRRKFHAVPNTAMKPQN